MTRDEAEREIDSLSEKLRTYQYEYYVLGRPSVSDREYDRLFDRLKRIEEDFPDLRRPDSPTHRVGSDLTAEFPEVDHTVPVLSLDKAYSEPEILDWARKTARNVERELSFVVEEKIDGVSIVLYYEGGLLMRAVTRGNGYVGNDVTANVKTIGSVPLRLDEEVDVAVRGEIYLSKSEFLRINESLEVPFANPRNLAAGTLRRQKSSEVAAIPLNIFCYEGYFSGGLEKAVESHHEALERMKKLGFRINPRVEFFSGGSGTETVEALARFIEQEEELRDDLEYEIDGLVIKIDEMDVRDRLGYTGHHPRWAIAYKFESPQAISKIKDIDIQVGRTGRITPVARIEPVKIGGSVVSNVTLHNQDYISLLEVAVGDSVAVSKRGDVIPAVEKVVEKNEEGNTTWKLPTTCPACGSGLTVLGAHTFCPNRKECPAQVKGRLQFFVGSRQMDIENLGPETLEVLLDRELVRSVEDIYSADYDSLKDLPGFGERKVELIKEGVEKSKSRPYKTVLHSLGIPELGPKVAELLIDAGFTKIDDLFDLAERDDIGALTAIPGIGNKTARTILDEFKNPQLEEQVESLKRAGLNLKQQEVPGGPELPRIFEGQTWCVTGSFENFNPRSVAMEEVKKRGGKTVSSVSGATTHLLAGSGAGSKLKKAQEVGARIVSEEEFIDMLESSGGGE
ncbi:MAG: NAD-dependent DNA ligase LigA [Spirochaetia bacterium]